MYEISYTGQFKKDYKKAKKRGLPLNKLQRVIEILQSGEQLPPSFRDHALTGNWTGHRECHLEPDWLLIYYVQDDVLVLTMSRTGSHSDLF